MNEMKKPLFCAAIGTGHATDESPRVLLLIKRNRRETIPPFSGRQPERKQQTCATQWVSSETTSARGGREGEHVQGVAPLSFLLSIYLSFFHPLTNDPPLASCTSTSRGNEGDRGGSGGEKQEKLPSCVKIQTPLAVRRSVGGLIARLRLSLSPLLESLL